METPLTLADSAGAKASNLAFALGSLPPDRRRDAMVFYAFCRKVDDIGDDPGVELSERAALLERWENALETGAGLPAELAALIAKYRLDRSLLIELVCGVQMDLSPRAYETYQDLRLYCWRVASAVGLVSIEIFGCRDEGSKAYAEHLGQALQLTNILRDVSEDARAGRIYLPREDLKAHGVTAEELLSGQPSRGFESLMCHEAERNEKLYREARQALPERDAHALIPAEVMRTFYQKILARMSEDGFRVFEKRYRLTAWEKAAILLQAQWKAWQTARGGAGSE